MKITEKNIDYIQEEGVEPACALLVTLRVLRVYIWAGVLYGNILFRQMEYSSEVEGNPNNGAILFCIFTGLCNQVEGVLFVVLGKNHFQATHEFSCIFTLLPSNVITQKKCYLEFWVMNVSGMQKVA